MTGNHHDYQDCGGGHDHKHCLEMFKKLSEYLDNELDELTCKEIEKHVNDCVSCHSCLQTLKRTVEFCKEAGNKPVPKDFSIKLKEMINNMPKTTNP